MSTPTYSTDVPDFFKDILSFEIFMHSLPKLVFDKIRVLKFDLSKGETKGKKIKFTRDVPIGPASSVTELQGLPEYTLGSDNFELETQEHGLVINVHENVLNTSPYRLVNLIKTKLFRSYSLFINAYLRNVIRNAPGTQYGLDKLTLDTITTAETFITTIINKAVKDFLFNEIPTIPDETPDGRYVCYCHSSQGESLKYDSGSQWIYPHQYQDTASLYNGEIGMWNNVRFVTTNLCKSGAATAGNNKQLYQHEATLYQAGASSQNLHEAYLCGDELLGHGVCVLPEIRTDIIQGKSHSHDIVNRQIKYGWYSNEGAALLNPDRATVLVTS